MNSAGRLGFMWSEVALGVLSGIAALFYAYWVPCCYFAAKLEYQRDFFKLVASDQREVELE